MTALLHSLTTAPGAAAFVARLLAAVTIVWIVAAVAAGLLRRSSAALRHRVWALSVLAALALPAAVRVLPQWKVAAIALPPPAPTPAPQVARTSPAASHVKRVEAVDERPMRLPVKDLAATRRPEQPAPFTPAAAPSSGFDSRLSIPFGWLAFAAWLLPAAWLLTRQALALSAAARLLRAAEPVRGSGASRLARLASRAGVRPPPRLVETEAVASPVCLGWLRPAIVLPACWPSWRAEQLDAVLTHELAHVARRDVRWQMLARLVCAVYWFHPLAWLAAWRMRVERELACDDWVLTGGEPSTRYARWLLDVAAMLSRHPSPAERVGVAMAATSNLENRVHAILDPKRRRLPVSRRGALILGVMTGAILLILGIVNPLSSRAVAGAPAEAAASAPATRPVVPADMIRITGRVTDEQGKAARGVLVELDMFINRRSAPTNADGRFEFMVDAHTRLFGGALQARSPDGMRMASFGFVRLLRAGETIEATLVLRPARQFEITVADGKGKPVAGAWIGAVAEFSVMAESISDAGGRASLKLPPDAPLMYVIARKDDVGLDYAAFWRKDQTKTDPYRLDAAFAGPLHFVLNGTTTVRVKVVDDDHHAVAGVNVAPWLLFKPKKGDYANLPGGPHFSSKTDARGIAEFHWIPKDIQQNIVFWARLDGYCQPKRCQWDPKSGKADVEATLLRLVPLSGTVGDADGKPVAGAVVQVNGDGHDDDSYFQQDVTTAPDGSFHLAVNPDEYYLLVAAKDHEASAAEARLVRKGAVVASIRLRLQRAAHVHGRITAGPNNAPITGNGRNEIDIILADDGYYKLPKEQQLPGEVGGRKAIEPRAIQWVKADASGNFECFVGPGKFQVYLPGLARTEFEVTDQTDVAVNLHLDQVPAGERVLKGRVVSKDPGKAIAEARILGETTDRGMRAGEAVSDTDGEFKLPRRDTADFYLSAVAPDGQRGIVLVKGSADSAVIPVSAPASAHGRLVDEQGKPLADRTIDYGIRLGSAKTGFTQCFGGETHTDGKGFFTAGGLVEQYEYELSVVLEVNEEGRPRMWQPVGNVKIDAAGRKELGDVKLTSPPKVKTAQDYAAEAFRPDKPFNQRLDRARHVAAVSFQRVMVVLAQPDAPAARKFFEYRYDQENDEVWSAMVDFVVIVVNTREQEASARQWAEKNQVTWPSKGMTLAVLEPAGSLVAQSSDSDLSVAGTLGRSQLAAFARSRKPIPPDAFKLLRDALVKAKAEDKRVLVDESAAYCPWCVRLIDYLDSQRTLLEKDFVLLTLDRRMIGGKKVMERLRKGDDRSTPWMAVLDAEGKVLITSDGPDGNVPDPETPDGRAHWEKMIRATTHRLTDPEIRQLLAPLKVEESH